MVNDVIVKPSVARQILNQKESYVWFDPEFDPLIEGYIHLAIYRGGTWIMS